MGEPICRNRREEERRARAARSISRRSRWRGCVADGAEVAASVADVVSRAIIVFLCLPSAKHVRAVFEGDGILKQYPQRPGRRRSRHLVGQPDPRFRETVAGQGAAWADAPIARTRQAAQDGTLSVMVGASPAAFIAAIEPLIRCFATDVTHCGDVGAGQVTKILNNMVLFETVNALSEGGRAAEAQRRRSDAACSIRRRRALRTALRCAITA